jgi:ABC-type xylose transport system permease subunit
MPLGEFGLFVSLAVAMNYSFKRTRWDRSMVAVGGNREAARPPSKIRALDFVEEFRCLRIH